MSFLALLTVVLTLAVLAGCVYLFLRDPHRLSRTELIKLGFLAVSPLTAYKLIAFSTLGVLPVAVMTVANLEVIEGAQTVESCGGCHIMWSMVNDMEDPASDSLAARHFRGPSMADHQCYTCHSGYGFNGALAAKLEGYRHLVRYTTGFYPEPVKVRGHFDSASCLSCHEGTAEFEAIRSHRIGRKRLRDREMSCLNCHGPAHPTRTERTPGSPEYETLMMEPSQ